MNWFRSRAPREQRLLAGGAALLAALLLYLLAWEPLAEREARLASRVSQQRDQLAWMQGAAAELRNLAPTAPAGQADDASLLSLIDRTAGEAGLGPAVRRLAPEGDREVRVWLGDAPYLATVRWLEGLARLGVVPRTVQMERHEKSGRVEARLLLGRAA